MYLTMNDINTPTKLKDMAEIDVTKFLEDCSSLRPKTLILDDLRWKYLVRSVLRGKNVMMVGPARCGKTKAAQAIADIFSEVKTEIMTEDELKTLRSNRNVSVLKEELL